MEVEQRIWSAEEGWTPAGGSLANADLVLLFGAREVLQPNSLTELAATYPGAILLGCTTAGEIWSTHVGDGLIVATAVRFGSTRVRLARTSLPEHENSRAAGEKLAEELAGNDLCHLFVLADGVHINGSELVAGLTGALPAGVAVTGGLAGDGARFERTLVCAGDRLSEDGVAAVGFYGRDLRVGYGSLGGWDPFGPDREITRCEGNRLYELDGEPALDLYKRYLGVHAADLPASALLFPLSVTPASGGERLVRTILGVDESSKSMVFAGDLPAGGYARLMKANVDRLIDGATEAAVGTAAALGSFEPDLAVLISCVGRRLVLRQRVEEEVESVRQVLGDRAVLTGFYSYGEIAPFRPAVRCELHNQTMTITAFAELPSDA